MSISEKNLRKFWQKIKISRFVQVHKRLLIWKMQLAEPTLIMVVLCGIYQCNWFHGPKNVNKSIELVFARNLFKFVNLPSEKPETRTSSQNAEAQKSQQTPATQHHLQAPLYEKTEGEWSSVIVIGRVTNQPISLTVLTQSQMLSAFPVIVLGEGRGKRRKNNSHSFPH